MDGVVNYAPTADEADEALWADCTIPARFVNTPADPSVLFGCAPNPVLAVGSTFTGPILQFEFNCKPLPGPDPTSSLTFVPRPGDLQGGSYFVESLSRPADPALSNANVTCAFPPTPTLTATGTPPTATATPTVTATPTATVTPTVTATPTATSTPTPTATATPTPGTPTDGGMAIDCDVSRAGIQSSCSYPSGATFNIEVNVTEAPTAGYFGFQAKVRWTNGTVNYLPKVDPGVEAVWPDCDIPARLDNRPGDPSVLFGCIPFPDLTVGSTFTGPILQFEFNCKPQPGPDPAASLTLVPMPGDNQSGTNFLDSGSGRVDPALTDANVTCVIPPTATPTPTPTNTSTPTNTPTPTSTPTPTATSTPTPTPLLPDLTVSKTDSPDPVDAGASLTYTIEVRNVGSASANAVRFIDVPDADFTYADFTTTRGLCVISGSVTGGTLDCDLGSIGTGAAAFATITITGYMSATSDTTISNTATVDPADLIVENDDANNSVTISTTVVAPTPTPTPTPDPAALDTDGDGCSDAEELGPNETLGGRRDPVNPWDFFDTPAKDGAVTIGDVFQVVAHFGDPERYGEAYDRTPLGPNIWNIGPPNGSVTTQDIQLVVGQFGHSCQGPL